MEFNLFEQAMNPEPLHEDLQVWLEEGDFPVLRHPLVYGVPYILQLNYMYNKQYEHKVEKKKESLEKGEWSTYIWIHERPYRFEAFLDIEHLIETDKEWWEILSGIWIDSENIWQHLDEWVNLFISRGNSYYFMDENERKAFEELPDEITIYRGHQTKNKNGLSWTLNEEKAHWFAKRFKASGKVERKTIRKTDVIAYLLGRNEQEIIYIPDELIR
jgi:hypothetical protein